MKASDSKKTTLKDVGDGLMLLGGFVLLLTAFFFIMSRVDEMHYGLFSRETHLVFYTVLGTAFLIVGLVLARKGAEKIDGTEQD